MQVRHAGRGARLAIDDRDRRGFRQSIYELRYNGRKYIDFASASRRRLENTQPPLIAALMPNSSPPPKPNPVTRQSRYDLSAKLDTATGATSDHIETFQNDTITNDRREENNAMTALTTHNSVF